MHVGKLIDQYIRKKRYSHAAVARALNRQPKTIARQLKRPTLQVSMVMEYSKVLKYNFLKDIANQFPTEFPPDLFVEKNEQIAQLQNQVEKLEHESQILREALVLVGGKWCEAPYVRFSTF